MKRTIAAVALVLAILAVGYWGMAGWWQEKRELSALQSEYESARELQQALLEEKTALEALPDIIDTLKAKGYMMMPLFRESVMIRSA